MNESQFDYGGASKSSRKLGSSSSGKPDGGGGGHLVEEGMMLTSGCLSPCGACKFLRRKCINGCIFAPYFGNDQGAAKFAVVHKVFGASNVSKLLLHIPASRRQDAVLTICYEAQARLSDPVYGCVSSILALQHQVTSLQAELEMVQTQVINKRYAIANAFQAAQTIPQYQNIAALHPTNLMNTAAGFEFIGETAISNHFDLIRLPNASSGQEEDDEEETHIPTGFTTRIFD